MAFIKFKPLTAEIIYNSVIENNQIDKNILELIVAGEDIFTVCKATRDLFILTNKRILIIDFKGVSGTDKNIYSIPLKSIVSYNINIHKLDTRFDIATSSGYQLDVKFSKSIHVDTMYSIYNYISKKVL